MRKNILVLCLILGFNFGLKAQESAAKKTFFKPVARKGKFYFFWGWNRSSYSKSDITFTGDGYDFTLYDVKTKDRPSKLSLDYINPLRISVPQYSYRFGYYINDKYSISAGFNHMKYVMTALQQVKISGTINTPEAGGYNGVYDNDDIILTEDFLKLEHTNGLNYINFNLERTDAFWISKGGKSRLNMVTGVGFGLMYPKSDVTLFGTRLDKWHIAGYGISSQLALRYDFLKKYFIQLELEGGFINMPDILTTGKVNARAKQTFFFFEQVIEIGGYFSLARKKKNKKTE